MGDKSKIEWTDASWSPIRARNRATGKLGWHCTHASEGCRNCYAERLNQRLGTGLPFKPGHEKDIEIFLDEDMLLAPLRWKKPRMIFVCSMTDAFGDWVSDEWIDRIFAVMALCPQHTFQVLTKRSARTREYMAGLTDDRQELAQDALHLSDSQAARLVKTARDMPLPNVWFGVSVEDQPTADARIPDLLATPAAVRFVSYEPALARVNFTTIRCPNGCSPPDYCNRCYPDGRTATGTFDARGAGLDWIICGGESGPNARPMLKSWAQAARDQCAAASVAYFHKQNGEWIDADEWRAVLEGGVATINKGGEPVDWPSPLNFEHAAILSGITGDRYEHHSDGSTMIRVGKQRAGRLLDGVEHNAMPEARR